MKLKVTMKLKNGRTISMIKRVDDPPKGTPLDMHYMFEATALAEAIQNGGLCMSISPNQIDRVMIQPREGADRNDSPNVRTAA